VILEKETCLPVPFRLKVFSGGMPRWLIKLIRCFRESAGGLAIEYITPDEMGELERNASKYGLTVKELMENAGRAVAEFIRTRYGPVRPVCVVCGGGNNGGDGFVAARYLSESGEGVEVVLLTDPDLIRTPEARENWDSLERTAVGVHVASDTQLLLENSALISEANLIVDAIFGTGVRGGVVKEPYATAISMINRARGVKVAVDLPSGVDPATGAVSEPAVRADVTVALHRPKVGLKGLSCVDFGELVVAPIGIKEEVNRGA
jgi:hydroxyethylthiazole kinase-like uncharacterized protein yjeF